MLIGTVVVLTFVTVLGLVLGAYTLFIARPEKRVQTEMRKRLKVPERSTVCATKSVAKDLRPLSHIGWLDRWLKRFESRAAKVQLLIEQGGSDLTVGVPLLGTAFSGMAGGFVGFLLTKSLAGAVAFGGAAAFIPYLILRMKRTKRNRVLEQQFPEAIELIARALRAGHPLNGGLAMASDELAPPVATEFRLLHERQNYGYPLSDALRNFAERVTLVDARFFVTAVLTQREAGGNLAEVLDNLASVMRERATVKRQMRVLSTHGRVTGLVLSALPPFMALALMVTSPSHLKMLWDDPLGRAMIFAAVILQTCGTIAIRKIVNVEY